MNLEQDWIKGKFAGSVGKHRNKFFVRFSGEYKEYKSFYTETEAIKYQEKRSNELGLTLNKYRRVKDYYEVQLTGLGEIHIGKIDIEFLEKFTERTWSATKNKNKNKNNLYMTSSPTKEFPLHQKFHMLVLTGAEQVDHIGGNGLDNRKKNLRDGSGRVNANNQSLFITNTSGANGVSFNNREKSWRASWYENGKRHYKSFSIKIYGSDEKAKQKAIEYRQAMDEITGCTNGKRRPGEPHIESSVSAGLV